MSAKFSKELRYTLNEFVARGTELYGEDRTKWKFICPMCGQVHTYEDFIKYVDKDTADGMMGFSCIGRVMPKCYEMGENKAPCNYTGGGLFRFNPVIIEFADKEQQYFNFADDIEKMELKNDKV